MFVFVSTTLSVFVEFNYDISEEISYLRLNDGHEPFEISTDSVVPAIQLISFSETNLTLSIADYVGVYATTLTKTKRPDGASEIVATN